MNIWEIFDTSIQLTWQQNGQYELAALNFENIPYVLQIYKTQLRQIPELLGKNTAEVSFFRSDLTDQQSFSTTYDVPSPTMLYGVISNALADKFANYDAFYFSAEKAHSSTKDEYDAKVSIYQYAARRMLKRYGAKDYVNINNRGTDFIISKIAIVSDAYKNPVKEYLDQLDWNTVPNIKSKK
jgi:CRISPR-associated Cas5-like protein